MTKDRLLEWLRVKLSDAEKSLAARREMEITWRGGDDRIWQAVGCKLSRGQRLYESEAQGRLAKKCQRDVEMFKATIAIIEGRTP